MRNMLSEDGGVGVVSLVVSVGPVVSGGMRTGASPFLMTAGCQMSHVGCTDALGPSLDWSQARLKYMFPVDRPFFCFFCFF